MRLDELNFVDMYPDKFKEFRADYRQMVRSNRYYVQFTNHAGDVLDKRMYDKPDHTDPMGVYTYPLSYVIKHPADIWYGKRAKFLRVIRISDLQTNLELQTLTARDMETIARKMGLPTFFPNNTFKDHLNKIKRKFKFKGTKALHKAFMAYVQLQLDDENIPTEKPITAKEQNMRFRKAGFKSITDNARTTNSALLNYYEPQQTVFLTRDSFMVERVYKLQEDEGSLIGGTNDVSNLKPKIAGMFGEAIQDGIVDSLDNRFWTKSGILMIIKYDEAFEMRDKVNDGERKKHKALSTSDYAHFEVFMDTKYGHLELTQEHDQTINSFVSQLVRAYKDMEYHHEEIDGWVPNTKESFQEEQRKKDEERKQPSVVEQWAMVRHVVDQFYRVAKLMDYDLDLGKLDFNDQQKLLLSKLTTDGRNYEKLKEYMDSKKLDANVLEVFSKLMGFVDKVLNSDLKHKELLIMDDGGLYMSHMVAVK